MEKRKPGIYAQWYEVFAEPKEGDRHVFLIFADQAKNYAQAVRFWNKTWGDPGPLNIEGNAFAIGRLVDCQPMRQKDEDICFVSFQEGLWRHIKSIIKIIK